MAQLSDQAGLSTDMYQAARPAASAQTGLSANHKKMLGITAATVLLGGVVGLAIANKPGTDKPGTTPVAEPAVGAGDTGASIPDAIDVAGKVTDAMSFEQAFEAARDEVGMGGAFNWHGRWYNTFEKEEWSGLSLEQRQEYTEMITGEKLPVVAYHTHAAKPSAVPADTDAEPTIIEGYLNGNRVMGLDFDRDGIIDTLVMEGEDGYTYRVVDTTGDQGLDTLYMYDSMDGEMVLAAKIDSTVLSNDDFNQGLEASMSREVVDSILDTDVPAPTTPPAEETVDAPEDDSSIYMADASEPDDTYVNNGDVRDMDE